MSPVFKTLTLETITCADCGLMFGVPEEWKAARRRDRVTFYCPNGHSQWFPGKTDAKARQEAEESLARERARHDQTKEALRHQERATLATRGHLTRLRRRAAAGLCPRCNRQFRDLKAHIAGKHPDYETLAHADCEEKP